MPLINPTYRVAVADPEGTVRDHTVTVLNGDRLRGELEAGRQGLPSLHEAPMNHAAVWVWCALVRDGLYGGKCADFRLRDLVALEAADDDEEVEPVDPTRPSPPSGSDSP